MAVLLGFELRCKESLLAITTPPQLNRPQGVQGPCSSSSALRSTGLAQCTDIGLNCHVSTCGMSACVQAQWQQVHTRCQYALVEATKVLICSFVSSAHVTSVLDVMLSL